MNFMIFRTIKSHLELCIAGKNCAKNHFPVIRINYLSLSPLNVYFILTVRCSIDE